MPRLHGDNEAIIPARKLPIIRIGIKSVFVAEKEDNDCIKLSII